MRRQASRRLPANEKISVSLGPDSKSQEGKGVTDDGPKTRPLELLFWRPQAQRRDHREEHRLRRPDALRTRGGAAVRSHVSAVRRSGKAVRNGHGAVAAI